MMKLLAWLKYLLYLFCILILVIIKGYIARKYTSIFKSTFNSNYLLLLTSVFIGIGIGLLIGLEHLIHEAKKVGVWCLKLPKLILLGIPALYISLTPLILYCGIPFIQNIIGYPLIRFLHYNQHSIDLFQLIFGYVIITCFYKKRK